MIEYRADVCKSAGSIKKSHTGNDEVRRKYKLLGLDVGTEVCFRYVPPRLSFGNVLALSEHVRLTFE